MERYKKILFPPLNTSQSSESDNQDEDHLKPKDKLDNSAGEGVLKITLHVLKEVGQKDLANKLEKREFQKLI